MNLHAMPERNLLVLAIETPEEAKTLAAVPAWAATAKTWSADKLPLIAIDAAQGLAALSAWDAGRLPPLALVAPPLSGISRAIGLQLIFDAFGYRHFNRAFGAATVFNNPAYIRGHGLNALSDVQGHVSAFAGAVGIAALNQPRGTIWDLHAPITPGPVLANADTRAVYLVRDPRDAVVSAYFFFKRSVENTPLDSGAQSSINRADFYAERKETALAALIEDGFTSLGGSGFLHHPSPRRMLEQALPFLTHPRVFVVRYERQHSDPVAQYNELVTWLSAASDGTPVAGGDALVVEAVRRGTFAYQTGGAVKEGAHDEAPAASPSGHVRKGVVGDWRNHFTPSLRRLFHERVGRLLIDAGFETDPAWWK